MNKNKWNRIDKLSKKLKSINYLGGKCEICGEDNFYKLCFHHKIGDKKENVSQLLNKRWSIIKKEIDKCQLLCNNCHQIVHYQEYENSFYFGNKKIYLLFKGINGCEKCGYNENLSVLDFHHPNNDKDFMLSDIRTSYKNIKELGYKIEQELNKCDVLCKNCHVELHQNDGFFYDNYNKILEKSENMREVQPKINRNEVKKLYESGMRQIDIAKYFSASKSTISSIVKKLKLPPKITHDSEEICNYYNKVKSNTKTGKHFNITPQTVIYHRKKYLKENNKPT